MVRDFMKEFIELCYAQDTEKNKGDKIKLIRDKIMNELKELREIMQAELLPNELKQMSFIRKLLFFLD